MHETKKVIAAAGANLEYEEHHISELLGQNEQHFNAAMDSIQKNKVCLKGFILAGRRQSSRHKTTMQMQMNQQLETYARVSHVKSVPGVKAKHENVDFITVRETTEGEYLGESHEIVPGVVESLKVITRAKCEQIAKFAFDYAVKHGRKKVTRVHKANIMKLSDGMFMKVCAEIAEDYPNIEYENMIVDNTCMQL